MDPAGIREILLLRPQIDNPYQFERAAEVLPYKTRCYRYDFNNPWLPIWPTLTQRVSTQSEGFPGWLQHDLAILAGVDMQACDERDMQNLCSAAARGLPLLLCGGQFGLGHSYRLWRELESALPARIPTVAAAAVEGDIRRAMDHPILAALPDRFAPAKRVHPLDIAADAQVLLVADGQPVLAVSERFGGRQAVLAIAEADGGAWDPLDGAGFYGDPFYGDLMRALMTWLMKVDPPVRISGLALDHEPMHPAADRRTLRVSLAMDKPVAVAALRCRLLAVDEARLMAGGEPIPGACVWEEQWPINGDAIEQAIELVDPAPRACSGLYVVELSAEMDDPPRDTAASAFGMAKPPRWSNWKDGAVERRQFALRFDDQRRTKVHVPWGQCALRAGDIWRVRVSPPAPSELLLTITDAAGREVGRVQAGAAVSTELTWVVPPLTLGDYDAALRVTPAEGAIEHFAYRLRIVHVPDPASSFQLIGHFSTGRSNDAELAERMALYQDGYGLDTLSLGAMRHAAALSDDATPMLERPAVVRRLPWLDAMVAAQGRHLWTDFDAQTVILATHGASGDYLPTEPCVLSPQYEQAVRDKLAPLLDVQRQRLGLISTETIDEPHLYPSNICRCQRCLAEYADRYGEPMPTWEQLVGDQTVRRWRLFEWLEDYTTRAFETAYRVKAQLAPELHLHNTAIDRLFSSNFMFNAIHRWARFGDELYMACYPWAYHVWRGRWQAPHSQTHWIAAWIRGLARQYDRPWGVFMELWEHDAPNKRLPVYWSVGQFYALLAEGATRMDTFYIAFGVEVFGISEPRAREFGAEIRKIRPFFPLLAQTRRPDGRIAFINPWCEWVMNPVPHRLPPHHEGYGYYRQYGAPFDGKWPHENRRMLAYELFHRAVRDVDQVDEQLFCEQDIHRDAVVVTDCRFLMQRTMDRLTVFVERGGVLVLDCEPSRNESGEQTQFVARLTAAGAGEVIAVAPGMCCRRYRHGEGTVLQFSHSLQESYGDALESGRSGLAPRIEQALAKLLKGAGAAPRWRVSRGDFDAAPRLAPGVCLVPVANLGDGPATATVTLAQLPFVPMVVADLTNGAFHELHRADAEVSFEVFLDRYHGSLMALWPDHPRDCDVQVDRAPVAAGEPLRCRIGLSGSDGPARGCFVVELSVTDPAGVTHKPLGGSIVVRDGIAEIDRVLPINASPGAWSIVVSDALFGLHASAGFEVA